MSHRFTVLLGTALLASVACSPTIVVRETPPDAQPQPQPASTRRAPITLDIPKGHYPKPGECRIWMPGTAPGQQRYERTRSCYGIVGAAPSGSRIVYRPSRDRYVIHVRSIGPRRPGSTYVIQVFDSEGYFVREEQERIEHSFDEEERPRRHPPQPPMPDRPGPFRPDSPNTTAALGIAIDQFPDGGQCRVWAPGVSAGQQRYVRTRACTGIVRSAPPGSWIIYRPLMARRMIQVRVAGAPRVGGLIIVRVYDAESGRFVREESYSVDQSPDIEERGGSTDQHRPDDRPRDIDPPQPPRQGYEPPGQQPPPVIMPERPRDNPAAPPPPLPPPPPGDGRRPPVENSGGELGIPPGHFPPPGECRIWIPGTAPGQQPHRNSGDCGDITRQASAGTWVVYRPTLERRLVHVRVMHSQRPGIVTVVRVFDGESGRFLREDQPRPEDHSPRPDDRNRPDERQQDDRGGNDNPGSGNDSRSGGGGGGNNRGGNTPAERGASLNVPASHFPPSGQCRVWNPGLPPGRQRQAPSPDCDGVTRQAPGGSWVLYRPSGEQDLIHVRVIDRRGGTVTTVNVFNTRSGQLIREERP